MELQVVERQSKTTVKGWLAWTTMTGVLHGLLTHIQRGQGREDGCYSGAPDSSTSWPGKAFPQHTADGLSGQESCEVLKTLALRDAAQPAVRLNVRL
jgi:hypothetical protein